MAKGEAKKISKEIAIQYANRPDEVREKIAKL